MVRLHDRRRRASRGGQLWRHLRAGLSLILRHPIPSVGIVPVLGDGRIVLVRRVDTDQFCTPGGMMDWGETVEATAARELAEETGLELVAITGLLGVYSSPVRDRRVHALSISVVARVHGDMAIQDPLELSEIRAFTRDEIPFGHLAFDHDQQLRDYLAGGTYVR